MMDFLHDTHAWYLISFLIFLVIAWRTGKPAILNMLDGRIETIRKEIETAENLRVEAQELLAQYQRKQRDAMQEAESVIETAKKNAATYKKQAEQELKENIERREKQLEERLNLMKQDAVLEIQSYTTELAIDATTQIIVKHLDKKANQNLVNETIAAVPGKL